MTCSAYVLFATSLMFCFWVATDDDHAPFSFLEMVEAWLPFTLYILFFFKILMSGPGGVDVGELILPLTDCSTQESGYCSSPGQLGRTGLVAVGAGELAPVVLESLPLPALPGRRTDPASHMGKAGELALDGAGARESRADKLGYYPFPGPRL